LMVRGAGGLSHDDSSIDLTSILVSSASWQAMSAALEVALAAGADVNFEGDEGTPLDMAQTKGLVDAVAWLEAHGAATPGGGTTPQQMLTGAVMAGRLDTVEELLESGADPNVANGDGDYALLLAAAHGYLEIAETLVGHGARLDAT